MSEHINRRQALAGFGSLGLTALLAACGTKTSSDGPAATTNTAAQLDAAGACSVVPELTEGPYYIDVDKVRRDIREDRPGTALTLAIRVRDFPGCTPRANAVVDVWHCDATGNYSGFESQSSGGPGGPPGGGSGSRRSSRGTAISPPSTST